MIHRRLYLLCLSAFLAGAPLPAIAGSSSANIQLDDSGWHRCEPALGVEHFSRPFDELFDGPQFVNVLRVNLDQSGIGVRFAAARHHGARTAPVPEFVEPAGAIAAINGGFGHGGPASTNSGVFKIDGEILPFLQKEPEELRFVGGAALGIDDEGEWHFQNRTGDSWPEDWPEMPHALAGGHRLIEDGEIHPSLRTFESALEERHAGNRHPRTAIGLLSNRIALLVTVDGRHPENADGMTLLELATFMKKLGCLQALNLDGGGSTTMWLSEEGVVNHPSDNEKFDADGLRKIRSAVVVLADPEIRSASFDRCGTTPSEQ